MGTRWTTWRIFVVVAAAWFALGPAAVLLLFGVLGIVSRRPWPTWERDVVEAAAIAIYAPAYVAAHALGDSKVYTHELLKFLMLTPFWLLAAALNAAMWSLAIASAVVLTRRLRDRRAAAHDS